MVVTLLCVAAVVVGCTPASSASAIAVEKSNTAEESPEASQGEETSPKEKSTP